MVGAAFNFVPQTAATTFAVSAPVFILFYFIFLKVRRSGSGNLLAEGGAIVKEYSKCHQNILGQTKWYGDEKNSKLYASLQKLNTFTKKLIHGTKVSKMPIPTIFIFIFILTLCFYAQWFDSFC